MKNAAYLRTQTNNFYKILCKNWLIGGGGRILVYAQKGPNMGGESCTVLRLRLIHKLAVRHMACNIVARYLKTFPSWHNGSYGSKGIKLTRNKSPGFL